MYREQNHRTVHRLGVPAPGQPGAGARAVGRRALPGDLAPQRPLTHRVWKSLQPLLHRVRSGLCRRKRSQRERRHQSLPDVPGVPGLVTRPSGLILHSPLGTEVKLEAAQDSRQSTGPAGAGRAWPRGPHPRRGQPWFGTQPETRGWARPELRSLSPRRLAPGTWPHCPEGRQPWGPGIVQDAWQP